MSWRPRLRRTTGSAPAVLPLDAVSSAQLAVGLRKLRTAYAGNCIEVRRSSDNTTQNIGFNGTGGLDTAALLTFVGAGNGFVRTWYDQSGTGVNFIQLTNALQPRIVNAGTIDTANSLPTVVFDLTYLSAASGDVFDTGFTMAVVAGVTTNVTNNALITKGTGGGLPAPWDIYNSSFIGGNGSLFTTVTMTTGFVAASGFNQWAFTGSSAAMAAYINGSANGTGTPSSWADTGNNVWMGRREESSTSFKGKISEALIYIGVKSGANLATLAAGQKAYYGTP